MPCEALSVAEQSKARFAEGDACVKEESARRRYLRCSIRDRATMQSLQLWEMSDEQRESAQQDGAQLVFDHLDAVEQTILPEGTRAIHQRLPEGGWVAQIKAALEEHLGQECRRRGLITQTLHVHPPSALLLFSIVLDKTQLFQREKNLREIGLGWQLLVFRVDLLVSVSPSPSLYRCIGINSTNAMCHRLTVDHLCECEQVRGKLLVEVAFLWLAFSIVLDPPAAFVVYRSILLHRLHSPTCQLFDREKTREN
mmetsp:Transcript_9493/g.29270  ORF Transcript_9493/g.29270 Transcript_9493/m.29270 type:complete len:254 (+) Transcript_9493:1955-2716(+)